MKDTREPGAFPFARMPIWRRCGYQSIRFWASAFAVLLLLGMGALLVFVPGTGQAQAATGQPLAAAPGGLSTDHTPTVTRSPVACGSPLVVTHVTNRTITVTRPDGSTTTVYVNSHTHYVKSGQTVTVSAVTVGSRIIVMGTCNNQGRGVTATTVEIVG